MKTLICFEKMKKVRINSFSLTVFHKIALCLSSVELLYHELNVMCKGTDCGHNATKLSFLFTSFSIKTVSLILHESPRDCFLEVRKSSKTN